MGVYVDDMRMPAKVGRIQANWSHLMADTTEELEAFAAKLGLNPRWIQYPGTWKEHYDVTDPYREKAIRLGAEAVEYGSKEMATMRKLKRELLAVAKTEPKEEIQPLFDL